MKTLSAFMDTPARVVIMVGLIVLVGEFSVMLLIEGVFNPPLFKGGILRIPWEFIDAIVLTVIVSPALYTLIFRPMHNQQVELEARKTLIETDQRAILGLKRYAENIIASLPAGLIVVNDALKVRSVNRSFREMFRLKNGEDVSGRELGDILPLTDLRQQAQAVLASGMALRGIDAALGEKWLRLAITGIRLAEEEEEEDLLIVVDDITELKAQAAHIEQLAFHDPLTGLPNRSLLRDRVQQVLTHSARHKNRGAILFIDLDNFKALNDTKGHNIGDLLLIEVAKRLQDCVRSSDTVARLGGDEFVVVLDELNEGTQQAVAQAQDIGEKVLASLDQPFSLQGFEHYSSASIGISLFRDNEIGMDDLFRHADAAMYQAKTSGRNTLRFFDPDMQASLEARTTLEADLRHALSQQQFKLFFQIQVDAASHPIGAETLLRWLHPERGLVSPLQFIPLAEDTGLILPIGQWVLETACAQIKAWETNPLACELQLAVNVSARQFHQPDFVEQVREVLKKTGADPTRLKLELTESVVLGNINDAVAKMRDLKEVGAHFSMDDFGTGYSSLSYLTQLPLDQLKIDLSFVHNIGIKPTDAVIVQTIISMGNSLGMEVIAEGVENEEQRDFLERNCCHAYQGYLFSKPVPIEEFEALIGTKTNPCCLTRRFCSMPALVIALLIASTSPDAFAADEIQVYNGDLRAAGESGVEIHLNYATKGDRATQWVGQIPTHHALNLTPEFSWHLTDNMDWGIYVPTTRDADANWSGNGIKGRVKYINTRGSEDDKTFWGVNLEVARNRITVSESQWSTELRGILVVETPSWAVTGNVMLGNDWSGSSRSNTPDLSVNGSVLRKIDSQWAVGLEHHASLGKINDTQPWSKSEQTTFLVGNYEGKGWGLHVGIGHNWTDVGDKTVVKVIVGIDF